MLALLVRSSKSVNRVPRRPVTRASFYLYFPVEDDARSVGDRLSREGYDVVVRLGADDVNWLALAEKDIEPAELDDFARALEAVASDRGGEYDGHEIDVP